MADSHFSPHRQITSQEEVQYFCTSELVRVTAPDTIKVDSWASALHFRRQSLLVLGGQRAHALIRGHLRKGEPGTCSVCNEGERETGCGSSFSECFHPDVLS